MNRSNVLTDDFLRKNRKNYVLRFAPTLQAAPSVLVSLREADSLLVRKYCSFTWTNITVEESLITSHKNGISQADKLRIF